MPRYVNSLAERFDKDGIVLGPFYQSQKAEMREARTGIFHQGGYDVLITSDHQDVCNRFGDSVPVGYCKQVLLTFGTSNRNQGSNVKPLRVSKDGARNFDRIVAGELVDEIDRGMFGVGQPPCEFCPGRRLNLARQSLDHLSKDPDILLRILTGYQ